MTAVYGPVPSWRLGRSLGIDPVCANICSFDCVYCQLGPTNLKTTVRRKFVDAAAVRQELEEALKKTSPDAVTFSGMGEPTMAENIGEIAREVKSVISTPMAILTNSSFLHLPEVREGLQQCDLIQAKLDAPNQELFERISRPAEEVSFEDILSGIKAMKREFHGRLSLQMMFIDLNKDYAAEMAELAREIGPYSVFLDTPLRPGGRKPLSRSDMEKIKAEFAGLNAPMVYDRKKPEAVPLDLRETRKRRPEW